MPGPPGVENEASAPPGDSPCRWLSAGGRGAARDRPGDVGRERVAVRPRPQPVRRRVGIGGHRRLHLRDHVVEPVSAEIHELFRALAEPVVVGTGAVLAHGGQAAVDAPADDLVARVERRRTSLDRDPRVDAEDATPAEGAGGVHLDDGLGGLAGSGACCEESWRAFQKSARSRRAWRSCGAPGEEDGKTCAGIAGMKGACPRGGSVGRDAARAARCAPSGSPGPRWAPRGSRCRVGRG